jgi:hypothetical protein
MRKIFLTLTLSLALAASVTAGEIPITGFAGCAPGLWYPESQVCVFPFSPQAEPVKPQSTIWDTMLIEALLYFGL